MNSQNIKDTIADLESFLTNTQNKLSEAEQAQLKLIISRFNENVTEPNREELLNLVSLVFRIMLQGTDFIHIINEYWNSH